MNTAIEVKPGLRYQNRTVEQFSSEITSKEIESWNEILNCEDSRELWNKVNWKDSTSQVNMQYPSAEALGERFQQKSIIRDETPFTSTTSSHVPILDDPITEAEIFQANKNLKEGKSTADG